MADRLQADQIKLGVNAGCWPQESGFVGSIVAGMVDAYENLGDPTYRDSAILGGEYILIESNGDFFGDQALALMRLSMIDDDPSDNIWRTAIDDFYFNVTHDIGGTAAYISSYAGTEPSTAVFYMACHTVAAYYVNATDKLMWRQGLIDWLSKVDDSSHFPVLAMGIATWALASTGPLDDTLIDPSGVGAAYWNLVKLSDLPDLLLGHQVPAGAPNAGSFYWRFDHTTGGDPGPVAGYTEDTIFPTIALVAVRKLDPRPEFDSAIIAARRALVDGIDANGVVYEHLSRTGFEFYVYAGEMLQALTTVRWSADVNFDGIVNFADLAIILDNWGRSDCQASQWCGRADIDHSGAVNFADIDILALQWLAE